ncbi:hypothetical protein BDF14DRAFT_1765678 [Spinellus fusiger]|nr:hypothetical protein BDF14DRAFT_1765678 [Spinellus fusiger]
MQSSEKMNSIDMSPHTESQTNATESDSRVEQTEPVTVEPTAETKSSRENSSPRSHSVSSTRSRSVSSTHSTHSTRSISRSRGRKRDRSSHKDRGRDRGRDRDQGMEEEELDEFGRVMRRRQKFASERRETEDGEYEEDMPARYGRDYSYDSGSDSEERSRRYHSRRRRSSSPRRRYSSRRYSDDEDERDSRQRYSHGYRGHSSDTKDPYAAAARYIDTEFFPTKIYIGDLERVSRHELEQAFSRFGPIRQVRMVDGKE